jgi:hypothetical protein
LIIDLGRSLSIDYTALFSFHTPEIIIAQRKIPKDEIPIDELIPSSIFGMLTDVVEELDKASLKKEY